MQSQQNTPNDLIYAANQPADLPERVEKLASAWQVNAARKSITRQFTFAGFGKAWQFMSLVADECKVKNHHPRWENMYNEVTIEWTTHKPKGLSIKDVEMAEFCDQKAVEIGLKRSSN
jgi:4a-hydroxytetrahydrobiopterin dehydratase